MNSEYTKMNTIMGWVINKPTCNEYECYPKYRQLIFMLLR